MATNNSVNLKNAGISGYDGAGTFTGTPVTQYNVLTGGATSSSLSNVAPSTSGFVLTSNGPSADPSFQLSSNTTFPYSNQGTSFTAAAYNGYFITATLVLTLPAGATEGNKIEVFCQGTAIVTITANTGQTIKLNTSISASAGTAANVTAGSAITLVFKQNTTQWCALSVVGSWTIT